jgi:tRNA G18 (ribose-2'-O)-methylase SpoU
VSEPAPIRRQLAEPSEILRALAAGEPVRLLLAAAEPADPEARRAVAAAHARGVAVRTASARSLWRLAQRDGAEVLALVGPPPDASLAEMLARRGVAWLLVGLAYPGNTGFAVRLAEVSGADGVVIDSAFLHEGRREALRAAMRAERFFPVFWETAKEAITQAKAAGRTVLAIETVDAPAPWETDLLRPLLLVVGGERHGIPPDVLAACDGAVRVPMQGFIPSYNLQAAMAIVAGERLRQRSQQASGCNTGV